MSVKPRTESGRDAMYRVGVEAALDAAADLDTSRIAGAAPERFVAGLAYDLGRGSSLIFELYE